MLVTRENNCPMTEMYMAVFEQSLQDNCLVAVDLELEKVGGVWLYANDTTMMMYQSFLAGSRMAMNDITAMGNGLVSDTSESMWEDSASCVAYYIDNLNDIKLT